MGLQGASLSPYTLKTDGEIEAQGESIIDHITQLGDSMARTCVQVPDLMSFPLKGPTLCLALSAQLLASVIPSFTAPP